MPRFFDVLIAPLLRINGYQRTINSQVLTVTRLNAAGDVLECEGTVVITGGGSGFAKDCRYRKTNVGAGSSGQYTNIGTNTSCNFVLVGSVTPVAAVTETVAAVTKTRLYTGTVTGTPVIGATLLQATSNAAATVTAVGSGYLDVTVTSGTFDATHLVTGTNPDTSTFTFTPPMTLIDVWTMVNVPKSFSLVASNTGASLSLVLGTTALTTGKVRFQVSLNQLETLKSDGYTALTALIAA